MNQEFKNAKLAGIDAARSGIETCPYKDEELKEYWWEGFRLIKPNGKTPIEDVFEVHCGGPVRREREIEWKGAKGVSTGRFLAPVGDWYLPDNYIEPKTKKPCEYNYKFQEKLIDFGAYDVTGIPYIHLKNAETIANRITDEGLKFVQEHGLDNIYIATGYQVMGVFLFARKPQKFKNVKGSYGQGACALFEDCPKSILIIAEDD